MVDFGDRLTQRDSWGAPTRPQTVQPMATYALLATLVAVWLTEIFVYQSQGEVALRRIYVIDTDWWARPWTLVTSTLAHSLDPNHLLFNALSLFFLGPLVERIIGWRNYLFLFFAAGAVAGVAQVYLASVGHETGGALGASGAIMALIGVIVTVVPTMRFNLYFVLPVPAWVLGLVYAGLDVLGILDPKFGAGIGHYAHLAGLALGALFGLDFKRRLRERGMRVVVGR